MQPTNINTKSSEVKNSNGLSTKNNDNSSNLNQNKLTDLESSLASLQNNLDINPKNKNTNKNHQWNTNSNQQGQMKTGGQNWKPGTTTSTTGSVPMTGWNPAMNVFFFSFIIIINSIFSTLKKKIFFKIIDSTSSTK